MPGIPDTTFVIPARNEAARLPSTLRRIHAWCLATARVVEVVVVDDRSLDDTARVAQQAVPDLTVRVLRCPAPGGVGLAVRLGMLASASPRIFYCDADGPVDLADAERLWRALDGGSDVAVGSRTLQRDSIVVRQPYHRVLMGRAWRVTVRRVVDTGVSDTQCGFKLFSRAAARRIFHPMRARSFAFHVEALWRARKLGLRVSEVPVRWRDVRGSKIHLIRDPASMLIDLARLASS